MVVASCNPVTRFLRALRVLRGSNQTTIGVRIDA